ncbi:uncharacterized protein LOC123560755 [Mercenaria mercenaria]|uniref:uncharacterized protein LOC123560755 n=1 Tax=Mercenaria mercenaria TaxID=6596 RepID=UPI00234F997A|nr:uncharacterized protein LOC123560755 [Mercenaria mercenaria]
MGKLYPQLITDAANEGKHIRLIGDNLNISVGTSHESSTNHRHMEHMFTSTCLVNDHDFIGKPEVPEINLEDLSIEQLLLSKEEYCQIRTDITYMVTKTISKYLPHLNMLQKFIPNTVIPEGEFNKTKKTVTIPLPCLPFNEQKYQDDVQILDWYQALFEKVIDNSTLAQDTKFQIGGDQLTRERLSEALLLRLDNLEPHDRFANIGRVTAEFFHLSMNLLEKGCFGELWSKEEDVELGTMRGECERVSRKEVDPNVMKAYDEDKRFAMNYLDSVTVEAALDFFDMENFNSIPNKLPPKDNALDWIKENIGKMVDKYVFPAWSGETQQTLLTEENKETHETLELKLADGSKVKIPIGKGKHITARSPQPDKVKDYMHLSMEILMIFKYMQELLKMPDRDRFLALLKMILIILKGHSNKAKYPREILRMLIQQYSVMGLREACMVFQACFVNTKGKVDSHVPADLVQEWNVKESKLHIKHMFSNKNDKNIVNKTAALPLIHCIAENMDNEIGTIVRSKRHKKKDSDDDELLMIEDFRHIRPFQHKEGRFFKGFKNVKRSMIEKVDGFNLRQWFEVNKYSF